MLKYMVCSGFKFSQLEMKIVLAKLLGAFKFEPADCAQDITWDMSVIAAPRLKTQAKHQLPIKISLLSKDDRAL